MLCAAWTVPVARPTFADPAPLMTASQATECQTWIDRPASDAPTQSIGGAGYTRHRAITVIVATAAIPVRTVFGPAFRFPLGARSTRPTAPARLITAAAAPAVAEVNATTSS